MRVIAGLARGRPLRAPDAVGIRPTGDKIKGVIFSMLEAEAMRRGFEPEPADEDRDGRFALSVAWPRVLELYAGSGALSIEALSRGCQRADLIEPNPAARRAIEANLAKTDLTEQARVHAMRSEQAVSTLRGPYDLILLDPPYGAAEVPALVERLAEGTLLNRDGVVVWEHARDTVPAPIIRARDGSRALRLVRTNSHGAAAVSLYASTDDPVGGSP
ncbi:MAG: 23S rRNA (adenine(2030)-N(6))-methyltransferase RlmJ [Chloroflexota bacterium]|nr:23S rRNA (adenine(2030)-N(6))-methyltransferase RlmJ [Chloroflexota bacterium]